MANQIKLKNGSGSDPSASDLVAGEVALRTDTGQLFTKKDDGNIAEIGAASGVSDGDKGDITVSNSGATFTIDANVVTFDKIQDLAQDKLLGRVSSGTGDIQGLSAANVRSIINVADGAQANVATNLSVVTGTGAVTVASSTGDNATIGQATSSAAGVMSTAHHDKLDGIASGATNVTNNNQLTNGAGFITESFPSGTRMLFQQTSAPTGWTKDTTGTNQRALRVVSGTVGSGGSVAFTTAFASQGVAGSVANTTAGGSTASAGDAETAVSTQGGSIANGGNNSNSTTITNISIANATQGGSIADGGNNTNNGGNDTNNKTNYSTDNATQGGSVATSAVLTTAYAVTSTNSVTQGGSVNNHTLSTGRMPNHRHAVYTTNTDQNSHESQGYPYNDNHQAPRTTDRGRNRTINSNVMGTTGSTQAHNHGFSGSSHSHSVNSHNHTVGDHSHGWSGSAHSHSMPNHNHSISAHSHTIAAHSHGFTGSAHSHTYSGSSHSHSINAHNHSFTGEEHSHTAPSHSHSFTGSAHNHSFSGTSINLAVQYLDVIIATKD